MSTFSNCPSGGPRRGGVAAAPLLRTIAVMLVAALPVIAHAAPDIRTLTVCADPDNLPYSNDKQEGFENRIAQLLAADLHLELRYFWFAEHRNFLRKTLLDHVADVVISVPASLPIVATTKPYFTSSYVAVMRAGDQRHFTSFDDDWLKDARIGLQLVGAEGGTTAPAASLTVRHLDQHITGFPMWDTDDVTNPQGRIIDAVADGTIDVAFVWGPFAGYFAMPHGTELRLDPITSDPKVPHQVFEYPMAIGVRTEDTDLRDRLQAALDRHRGEITAILQEYRIPLISATQPAAGTASNHSSAPPLSH